MKSNDRYFPGKSITLDQLSTEELEELQAKDNYQYVCGKIVAWKMNAEPVSDQRFVDYWKEQKQAIENVHLRRVWFRRRRKDPPEGD